ncbi:MAG: hypothetical protein HZA50_04335 [Planctomycetes bacterium]|nr:hypothetical protein [Planctomycetota bacterium]
MTKKKDQPEASMEQIIRADGRYPLDAFAFLHEALAKTSKSVHGEQDETANRHVSGQQLCCGLRDLALERWGPLAKTVLARWNIRGSIDFGNMVYLLIKHNMMRKTDEDSLEDFRNVFDFEDAFKFVAQFELKE